MRSPCARSGALLAAIVISAVSVPQRTTYAQPAPLGGQHVDSAAVRSLWSGLDASWNARDAEQFSRVFTEDGSLGFVNFGRSLESRAAIRQHFVEEFPRYAPDARHVTQVRVIRLIARDVIAVDGDVEIVGKGPAGSAAPTVLRSFVVSAVLVRNVQGWSIRVLRAYQLPAARSAPRGEG